MTSFEPRAVVFLGNPGAEYAKTRHNAGWRLAQDFPWSDLAPWQKKFKGVWSVGVLAGRKLYALLPETYMNLSGESARALGDFFDITGEAWLVVHDDIDLPFGEVRLQKGGGLGGHNGLRSLKAHLGTSEFFRLRLGLGRPERGEIADFVLGRLTIDEESAWPGVSQRAISLVTQALGTGEL